VRGVLGQINVYNPYNEGENRLTGSVIMSNYILTRIEALQQELERLKEKVMIQEQRDRRLDYPQENRPKTQLRGIWAGVEIPDELLEEAKDSLVSKDYRAKP
jgi:hypothetical protein